MFGMLMKMLMTCRLASAVVKRVPLSNGSCAYQ